MQVEELRQAPHDGIRNDGRQKGDKDRVKNHGGVEPFLMISQRVFNCADYGEMTPLQGVLKGVSYFVQLLVRRGWGWERRPSWLSSTFIFLNP